MANVTVAPPASEGFLTHLTTASGRTNRAKFWLAILVYMIVYAVALGLVYAAGLAATGVGLAVVGVVALALTVSSLLVSIRRLHDRDRSGHWLWLLYGVPGVLNSAANVFVMTNPEALVTGDVGVLIFLVLVTLVSLGFVIWAIVWLGALRGTEGPNRFGPDPLRA